MQSLPATSQPTTWLDLPLDVRASIISKVADLLHLELFIAVRTLRGLTIKSTFHSHVSLLLLVDRAYIMPTSLVLDLSCVGSLRIMLVNGKWDALFQTVSQFLMMVYRNVTSNYLVCPHPLFVGRAPEKHLKRCGGGWWRVLRVRFWHGRGGWQRGPAQEHAKWKPIQLRVTRYAGSCRGRGRRRACRVAARCPAAGSALARRTSPRWVDWSYYTTSFRQEGRGTG